MRFDIESDSAYCRKEYRLMLIFGMNIVTVKSINSEQWWAMLAEYFTHKQEVFNIPH